MANRTRDDNIEKMIVLANKFDEIDSAYHSLIKHIQTDKTIVMVSWANRFEFNEALLLIKDYVLVCYCEYGYDHDFSKTGTHLWGYNTEKFPRYYTGDWVTFDNWVKENKPTVLLKRELMSDENWGGVKPIDYIAPNIEPVPVQSEEEFNNRPLSLCYYFGRSHEGRLLAHSSIWSGATKYGYSVVDNLYYVQGFIENEKGKKYASFNIPHYQRHPIENILMINGLAKIGFAPFGAGQKTFRSQEVSANAVLLLWEDDLVWAYPWIHGVNCIKCKQGEEVETIEKWTQDERLYSIYKAGVETWNNYRVENYINNYLLPIINNS